MITHTLYRRTLVCRRPRWAVDSLSIVYRVVMFSWIPVILSHPCLYCELARRWVNACSGFLPSGLWSSYAVLIVGAHSKQDGRLACSLRWIAAHSRRAVRPPSALVYGKWLHCLAATGLYRRTGCRYTYALALDSGWACLLCGSAQGLPWSKQTPERS